MGLNEAKGRVDRKVISIARYFLYNRETAPRLAGGSEKMFTSSNLRWFTQRTDVHLLELTVVHTANGC